MNARAWLGRLRSLVARGRRLREHDDEVQTHLRLLASDLEQRGWAPDAARREARRLFGGPDQIREAYRDVSGFPSVDALMQDLRYGIRMLRRQPGFSVLVVLLVAIGVGANNPNQALPYVVGEVAQRAHPKRLVLSHIANFDLDAAVTDVKKTYTGALTVGADLQCYQVQ